MATISTEALQPTTTLPVTTVPDLSSQYTNNINSVANLTQQANDAALAEKTAQDQYLAKANEKANLESSYGMKANDTANLYQTTGVNDLYKQISGINTEAQGLARQAQAIPLQLQQEYTGRLSTQAGTSAIEAGRLRENALKSLELGQRAAIAQGNYDVAKNLADQQIASKYAGIDAEIKSKQTNLEALDKITLTAAQEKRKAAQTALLTKQANDVAEQKANDKALSDIIIQASTQNAPANLLEKAKLAKTPAAAAMILGQYAGDYYKTELLKNQIATEKAQAAKYYSDIENAKKELALKLKVTPAAAADKIQASQDTYNLANELLTLSGKGGAVGFGLKKTVFSKIPGIDDTAIAGTDRANYEAKVSQLRDTLASANLDKIKGAMSDKDIEFLRNIGTALKLDMPETAFDAELEKIKNTMAKVSGVVPITPVASNPFAQAIGQSNQVIPGAAIINNVTPSGELNFKLP